MSLVCHEAEDDPGMVSFAEGVTALRLFFGVEPCVSLPAAIQQMNMQMGIAAEGTQRVRARHTARACETS